MSIILNYPIQSHTFVCDLSVQTVMHSLIFFATGSLGWKVWRPFWTLILHGWRNWWGDCQGREDCQRIWCLDIGRNFPFDDFLFRSADNCENNLVLGNAQSGIFYFWGPKITFLFLLYVRENDTMAICHAPICLIVWHNKLGETTADLYIFCLKLFPEYWIQPLLSCFISLFEHPSEMKPFNFSV